jgi:DNA-binding response OmpR family regulator
MGLTDMAGLDVLRSLRERIDDYITKPFIPIELMARVDQLEKS